MDTKTKRLNYKDFKEMHGGLLEEKGIYTNLISMMELFDRYHKEGTTIYYELEDYVDMPYSFVYDDKKPYPRSTQIKMYERRLHNTNMARKKEHHFMTIRNLNEYRIIMDAFLSIKFQTNPSYEIKEEFYNLNEALYKRGHGTISQYYKQLTKEIDVLKRLNEQDIYTLEDAIDDGLLGLLDAAGSYKLASGMDFVKYAEPFMRQRMTHAALEASNPDLPGGKLSDYYYRIMKLHDKYMLEGYEEEVNQRMIHKDINEGFEEEIITTKMIEQALDYRYRYDDPRNKVEEELNPFMSMETFAKTHLYEALRPYFRINLHKQFVRIFERMHKDKEELILFIYDLEDDHASKIEELSILEEAKYNKHNGITTEMINEKIDENLDQLMQHSSSTCSIDMRKEVFASLHPHMNVDEKEIEAYEEMASIGGKELENTYYDFMNNYVSVKVFG